MAAKLNKEGVKVNLATMDFDSDSDQSLSELDMGDDFDSENE